MNTKKKILSVALAVSLAAIAVVGSSLAYFTDKDHKDNTYTVGSVKIQLTEEKWDAENAKNMYPGEEVAKNPVVHNNGKNAAFVRIKVSGDENFNLQGLSNKWTLKDGYYYYNTAVEAGQATDELFKGIQLKTDVENDGTDTEKTIKVEAEAIQAQGAPHKAETITIEEIADWFKNFKG